MSKIKEALRAKQIFNTHGVMAAFGGKNDVAISYHATDPGRGGRYAHTNVWSVHFKTDPKSHWQGYGRKCFSGNRQESLPAAMAWATETYYGGTDPEWTPCPTGPGDYVPKRIADAAKKFAKTR